MDLQRMRTRSVLPGVAVAAVAGAALGAALAPADAPQSVGQARPSLSAPAAPVVKAPPEQPVMTPAVCRDCASPAPARVPTDTF